MKGGGDVLRELSPMEGLSYYYHIKYPQRRDVNISAASGIKVSTLVTAKRRLESMGLLKYRAFPFNFSEPMPYIFLLTIQLEGEISKERGWNPEALEGGRIYLPLSMCDGTSKAALVYAARYTDFFKFKHSLLREISTSREVVSVKEYCLMREGLFALNLFDHSGRVAWRLLSERPDARWVDRLREEEAALGDNELIALPEATTEHLQEDEEEVLKALLRNPIMNYIELSRATGINRQRAARIKKGLDKAVYYRAYVDPFTTLRENEIVVIHVIEHSTKVDGEVLASLYKKRRDEFRKYNVLFLHSGDTTLMIGIYPTFKEYRKWASALREIMRGEPFDTSSLFSLVMTPGEGFEA